MYEYIIFDGEASSFGAIPGMLERTITVNGFSKSFAMTGWRLGYAAAPEPIARSMARMQSAFTAGANSFVQRAAIAALEAPRDDVIRMRESYRRRRDMVVAGLSANSRRQTRAHSGNLLCLSGCLGLHRPAPACCDRRQPLRLAARSAWRDDCAGIGIRRSQMHTIVLRGQRARHRPGPRKAEGGLRRPRLIIPRRVVAAERLRQRNRRLVRRRIGRHWSISPEPKRAGGQPPHRCRRSA